MEILLVFLIGFLAGIIVSMHIDQYRQKQQAKKRAEDQNARALERWRTGVAKMDAERAEREAQRPTFNDPEPDPPPIPPSVSFFQVVGGRKWLRMDQVEGIDEFEDEEPPSTARWN